MAKKKRKKRTTFKFYSYRNQPGLRDIERRLNSNRIKKKRTAYDKLIKYT